MYIDTTFPPECSGRLAQFMRGVEMLDSAEIGYAVDALIEKLDQVAGDPDIEDDDPAGTDLDRGESGAWAETDERQPAVMKGNDHEDDEDDDQDCCKAGDDHVYSGNAPGYNLHLRFGPAYGPSIGSEDDHEPNRAPAFANDDEEMDGGWSRMPGWGV